jgi:transcriptional regulator with XRE-family HTH domain
MSKLDKVIGKIVGKNIKELREVFDMTQAEFAQHLNIDRGHVSKIETAGARPSKRLLKAICEEFNVNMDWLLTGSGEMVGPDSLKKMEKEVVVDLVVADAGRMLHSIASVLIRLHGGLFEFDRVFASKTGSDLNPYRDFLLKMKTLPLPSDDERVEMLKLSLQEAKSAVSMIQDIIDNIEKRLPK